MLAAGGLRAAEGYEGDAVVWMEFGKPARRCKAGKARADDLPNRTSSPGQTAAADRSREIR
jgi:hypothetical protein